MNSCNRQAEVHYIDTGFAYTATESFMDLFEGLTYAQGDFTVAGHLQDQVSMQESAYWSMHMNLYKYGLSGSVSNSYYSYPHAYEVNDNLPSADGYRSAWDNSLVLNTEEPPPHVPDGSRGVDTAIHASTEECIRSHDTATSSQVIWQDDIDPDNMTYEELLDLGEAVGTQSRGLSQELILSLPISKYKCSLFSRKKTRCERCVICQMDYKRGDRQITLPCRHAYHASCVTRWLSINKACPMCYTEVFGEDKH